MIANTTIYNLADIAITNSTATDASLVCWIDFDDDGLFEESEHATVAVPAGAGATSIDLNWMGITIGVTDAETYARFRLY